jgi:DNA-binding LacI/PurR family transcriptional regulator
MESRHEPGTPPGRRPTIRDVARAAGVGLGTASRVLTGAPGVSSEAQEKVEAAIRELGFEPSRAARALRGGRTHTIGVLIPFFTRHYFLEILRGIEAAASDRDYGLNIYNVEQPEHAFKHLQFLGRSHRVDALIVVALDGEMLEPALPSDGQRLPIVAVDTRIDQAPAIEVDYEAGMRTVVRYLVGRGHQRIALIDRPADPVSDSRTATRRSGYERALGEAGIEVNQGLMVVADYSADGGRYAAADLLQKHRPTALVCSSDLQALGALQAVRDAGLSVPEDVAVTGFHDVEIAGYVGLTTVRVAARDMGRAAVEFALASLDRKTGQGARKVISASLVVRSTA